LYFLARKRKLVGKQRSSALSGSALLQKYRIAGSTAFYEAVNQGENHYAKIH
jgi:hypothetical protein